MTDIASGMVGPETKYDVAFTGGKLMFTLNYTGTQAGLALTGSISGDQLIEALASKVTNPLEHSILEGLKAILTAIP